MPYWLKPDFRVKWTTHGWLILDGDTPVSNSTFITLAAANGCCRELQQRRETMRARYAS
jgi:hypothetical protein